MAQIWLLVIILEVPQAPWVENGEILYPVSEITVASNLKDIFKKIVSIGNDFIPNTSKKCGSMLIEEMTIAGA